MERKTIERELVDHHDLSTINISHVVYENTVLTISPQLTIKPRKDEHSNGLFFATNTELNMHIYATSSKELVKEAEDYIRFLWDAYAKSDQSKMDDSAKQFAQNLLLRISQSSDV